MSCSSKIESDYSGVRDTERKREIVISRVLAVINKLLIFKKFPANSNMPLSNKIGKSVIGESVGKYILFWTVVSLRY